MTDETALAFARVMAATTRAQIRVAAMQAENARRAANGYAPAYTEQNFMDLIDQENLGYNAVILEMRL